MFDLFQTAFDAATANVAQVFFIKPKTAFTYLPLGLCILVIHNSKEN